MTTTQSPRVSSGVGLPGSQVASTPSARGHGVARTTMPLARRLLPAVPIAVVLLVWYLLTANDVVAWTRFDKIPGPAESSSLLVQLESGVFYEHTCWPAWAAS